MKLIDDIKSIFIKDKKLFLMTNAFYFGLVVLGALIAMAAPQAQRALFELAGPG